MFLLKKLYKVFIAFSFLVGFGLLKSFDKHYLRDTLSILKPEYQHFSPVYGALYYDLPMLSFYLSFGNIQRTPRSSTIWIADGDGVVQMTHALFVRIGDTVSVSTNVGYPAMHMSMRTLGHIVAAMEKHKNDSGDELARAIELVIKKDEDFSDSVKRVRKEQPHVNRLGFTKKDQKKGVDYHRIKEFAQFVAKAQRPNAYYPVNSAFSILLAVVYVKAQSKEDIWTFFSTIEQDLGVSIFRNPQDHDSWVQTAYPRKKKERIALMHIPWEGYQEMERLLVMELLSKSSGKIPEFDSHQTVAYQFHLLADCMETAIRNISNVILYDPSTNKFRIEYIKTLQDHDFRLFCEQHEDVSAIRGKKTHNDWLNVVENRPLVVYSWKIFHDAEGKPQVVKADQSLVHGFVYGLSEAVIKDAVAKKLCIKEGSRIRFNKKTFELLDPSKGEIGFEVTPSIYNLIIMLDTLYGTKIVTQEDFFNPSFIHDSLARLCGALNLQLSAESSRKLSSGLYDQHDFTRDFKLELNFKKYKLVTDLGHGESVPVKSSDLGLAYVLQQQISAFDFTQYSAQAAQLVGMFRPSPIETFADQYKVKLPSNSTDYASFGSILASMIALKKSEVESQIFDSLVHAYISTLPILENLSCHHEVWRIFKDYPQYRPSLYSTIHPIIDDACKGRVQATEALRYILSIKKTNSAMVVSVEQLINIIKQGLRQNEGQFFMDLALESLLVFGGHPIDQAMVYIYKFCNELEVVQLRLQVLYDLWCLLNNKGIVKNCPNLMQDICQLIMCSIEGKEWRASGDLCAIMVNLEDSSKLEIVECMFRSIVRLSKDDALWSDENVKRYKVLWYLIGMLSNLLFNHKYSLSADPDNQPRYPIVKKIMEHCSELCDVIGDSYSRKICLLKFLDGVLQGCDEGMIQSCREYAVLLERIKELFGNDTKDMLEIYACKNLLSILFS